MAQLLTADEVAERLQVSAGWVRDHANRREPRLPCVKLGNNKQAVLRFHPDDIEEFIEKWSKKK